MGHAQHLLPTHVTELLPTHARWRPETFNFHSLVFSEPQPRGRSLATTLATSMALHVVLVAAVALLPILLYDAMPEPGATVRAFFVAPADMAPPPPPPPPPPAGVTRTAPAVTPPPQVLDADRFVAPIEIPDLIKPEAGLDLGVEGGVPGGVEGGVPGGVLGGIVGGIPLPPPPPTKVVRVGGAISAPKLLKKVAPVYPDLATASRVQGIVIVEAHVDVNGYVKSATVLRSVVLLDEAALDAVRQWRYKPLLLNGEPMEFILTVTFVFNLANPNPTGPQ